MFIRICFWSFSPPFIHRRASPTACHLCRRRRSPLDEVIRRGMAKRTHVSAVGWVDSDEFTEIGGGRSEGWLADSSLLAAIQFPYLVLAQRNLAVVVGWDEDPDSSSAGRSFRIRPALSPSEGEITAVEWIAIDEFLALALGTSGGYLLLYSKEGALIHKQVFLCSC